MFMACSEGCDFSITSGLGAHHYRFDMEENQQVCVNITTYSFYIMFNDHNPDALYYHYISYSSYGTLFEDFHTQMRFLPIYQQVRVPYGSVTIKTPSSGHLSFTILSYPGMCGNGIFFSNYVSESLNFRQNKTDFYGLQVYDDKCFIFSAQGIQNISLSMESSTADNQLYVYRGYDDYTVFNGNVSEIISNEDNPDIPILIRIAADDQYPPVDFVISMISDSDEPKLLRSEYYVPPMPMEPCNEDPIWFNEKVAITMIIICSILGLGVVVGALSQCVWTKPSGREMAATTESTSIAENVMLLKSIELPYT